MSAESEGPGQASAEARLKEWYLTRAAGVVHFGSFDWTNLVQLVERIAAERERLAYERAAKAGGEARKRLVSDGATIMEIRAVDVVLSAIRALADGVEATRE
jgi:hypothetical protein